MKISVIGAGYVGLTAAACFAQIGHSVFCSESDIEKLNRLQNGIVPIFEPGLEGIVSEARKSDRLVFGSSEEAIHWGKAIFICVGTPPLPNGDADLSAVEAVARAISKLADGYHLVVEKSTVPVQTAAQLRKHLLNRCARGSEFDVASNPEFLREGSAVEDFLHPDRIVIGVESQRAEEILRQIYEPVLEQSFVCPMHSQCPRRDQVPFLVTDTKSAELIKHASNSFLAMKISYINMVADLCELVGADVTKVAQGMGLDARIGSSFLSAGLGFGGFCFPKDLQAFIRIAGKSGCDFSLLKEVEKINQRRISSVIEKLREELWILRGKKVAVWGLAFKPNTDDVRFAPSLALVQVLVEEGVLVSAYDPQATEKAKALIPGINYCANPYEAAQDAEAVLIVTEWDEFRAIDWQRVRSIVERPLIVDGRNMFNATDVTSQGFHYVSIGRAPKLPASEVPTASDVQLGLGPESNAAALRFGD
jgi:UDPglucose 6-dehydrogenase